MFLKRMGEVYSSGDAVVTLAGLYDINPSAIAYSYSYAHEYQRGIKRAPRGWRMGQKEYEGTITLPLDVVSAIEKFAPKGDIARIRPFPINVTFFNAENELINDLVMAKFQGNGRNVTGDGELEREFQLFIIDVKLNVGKTI
ncbi:hypothetical protein [Proteiniphilum sp.]|uniref:hypothetical protein n=1 Tax=Proteiniphilum sp. TaxID=1926877 RepID=UPI002B1EEE44|nr:hypothetical protein [Proteiniphilum sp.]MEA4916547.1 hypothetical protein [Proteiniphilum sp.]MEA4948776.1 hypothetical protein [Petrimonas sp.]